MVHFPANHVWLQEGMIHLTATYHDFASEISEAKKNKWWTMKFEVSLIFRQAATRSDDCGGSPFKVENSGEHRWTKREKHMMFLSLLWTPRSVNGVWNDDVSFLTSIEDSVLGYFFINFVGTTPKLVPETGPQPPRWLCRLMCQCPFDWCGSSEGWTAEGTAWHAVEYSIRWWWAASELEMVAQGESSRKIRYN